MTKEILTQDLLNELFVYDQHTGILTNRIQRGSRGRAGYAVGYPDKNGYLTLKINGNHCRVHRVIWVMVTGEFPDEIDHINGITDDNRITNLRSVSKIENHQNTKLPNNNTSGVIGVYWSKRDRKWCSSIRVNNGNKSLGNFDTIKDAAAARREAEIKYGFHENHGRIN